jgi:predicted nucleic acid-binding protein
MHSLANAFLDQYDELLLTSEFVLVEVGNWMGHSGERGLLAPLIADIQSDQSTTIVEASHDWFTAGLSLYGRRLDKEWSLTYCISMEIMHQHGLQEVLTADHHFEQAGFEVLLK